MDHDRAVSFDSDWLGGIAIELEQQAEKARAFLTATAVAESHERIIGPIEF